MSFLIDSLASPASVRRLTLRSPRLSRAAGGHNRNFPLYGRNKRFDDFVPLPKSWVGWGWEREGVGEGSDLARRATPGGYIVRGMRAFSMPTVA